MAVNDRRSIFFTGAAGTGKSRVLDAIVLGLEARRRGRRDEYPDDRVAVIAPTGMAASLIRGKTLHAWAGIPPGAEFSSTVLEVRKNMNPRALERWTHVWVIVIDEVSMVSAKLFSFMAALTRLLRPQKAIRATWAKRPVHKRFSKASKVACAADWPTCQTLDCPQNNTFGGIQLVVTGDFLQLPPVAPREEEEKTAAAPRTGRGPASQKRAAPAAAGLSVSRPDFAFKSKDCKGQFFAECQLKQIFRQNDGLFCSFLNGIRVGKIPSDGDAILRMIRSEGNKAGPAPGESEPASLYSTNGFVNDHNANRLRSLGGKAFEYFAHDSSRCELKPGEKQRVDFQWNSICSLCGRM